ncbi:hypothetical protein B0180_10005 [Moraxella canis]|uniref:Uncharacterized protein n=1 Tax=Moraxella canis TaxID=90239 RepID=A0A1S9ZF81_9GAMM|nr:hypothetical protein B0180_10005 [Moraxella canis]
MGDRGIAKGERLATGMVSTVSQNRETYNRALTGFCTEFKVFICGNYVVLIMHLQNAMIFEKFLPIGDV